MDPDRPASLPEITSVELVILRNVRANRVDHYLDTPGLPSVTVVGVDAQRIAHLWRNLPPGIQARCHIPPYGLRFRSDDRIVCKASICWQCNNIYGEAEKRDLHYAFDSGHATSQELLAEIRRAIGDPN